MAIDVQRLALIIDAGEDAPKPNWELWLKEMRERQPYEVKLRALEERIEALERERG